MHCGYIDYAPTFAERASSTLRSARVGAEFEPKRHPPFERLFGEVWTQHVNACTGFALAKGAMVMAAMQGISVPPLSAFSIYTPARQRRGAPLEDNGARVSDAVWAWNKIGACEERFWPSHSLGRTLQRDRVNYVLHGLDSSTYLVNAAMWRRRLPIQLNRIVAVGPRLVQRALHSLDRQQYVLLALPVGAEFEAGRSVLPAQAATRGLHLIGLLDWRQRDGQYEGLLGNSWGAHWGSEGKQWASAGLIGQATAAFYFEGVG